MREDDYIKSKLSHLEHLQTTRYTWESLWQRCTDYVNPRRGDFAHSRVKGSANRYDYVLDSTALQANVLLAAGLHGHLTNTSERWFKLVSSDDDQTLDTDAYKEWLQAVEDLMFESVFNNNATNFLGSMHELYLDLGSYGTSVLYIEDTPGRPIFFKAFHLMDCYISENIYGIVDTLYRKYTLTGKNLLTLYEKKLPQDVRDMMYKEPFEEHECLHVVEPRNMLFPSLQTKLNKPFSSCHILMETETLLDEGGFDEFPYMVPRWSKTSGEIYGRSPAMQVMPDILELNQISASVLKTVQRLTDPPMKVPVTGVKRPLDFSPGAENPVAMGTDTTQIAPLFDKALDITAGMTEAQTRRDIVLRAFHVDWLHLPAGPPEMTATEVLQREEDRTRMLGPVIGRLQTELLDPLIQRVINILHRRKELPESLEGESEPKVSYVSPIARAQKAKLAFNFNRALEFLIPLYNLRPEGADVLDTDKLTRWMFDTLDGPVTALRAVEEVEALRQARAEQMERSEQAAVAQQETASVKNVGSALKDISALGGADERNK